MQAGPINISLPSERCLVLPLVSSRFAAEVPVGTVQHIAPLRPRRPGFMQKGAWGGRHLLKYAGSPRRWLASCGHDRAPCLPLFHPRAY